MKFFFAALFISPSVFASASEVILTCTNSSFEDLKEIVVTVTENDQLEVTERASNGKVLTYIRNLSDLTADNSIELSDWYGYSRTLYKSGSGWSIEHRDECSGGYSSIECK
jgi:hypothetical protein